MLLHRCAGTEFPQRAAQQRSPYMKILSIARSGFEKLHRRARYPTAGVGGLTPEPTQLCVQGKEV